MPATFSNDYGGSQAKLPGRETVTYRAATSSGYDDSSVANAIRYPITLKEMQASYGVYVSGDVVWTLGERELAGISPKPRDVLLDDAGDSWTILDAAHAMLGRFWRVNTRNLAIANQLYDTVDLQHPTITQTAAGNRSVAWTTVATGVHCRVQPRQTEAFDERGVRSSRTVYDVFFASNVSVTAADGNFGRLVWGSVNLQIVTYKDAERIDSLPVAECHKVP